MDTWVIVLIIVAVLIVLYLYSKHAAKVAVAKKASAAGGAGLVSAAGSIPIYGTYVKAVATVGKPVNHALDKVNTTITAGLQHIPIAGKYLAMPNQVLGAGVKKINTWLGLD
jgi:hypothetical protein